MKWNKRGLIYNCDNVSPWMYQSAMLPTPVMMDDYIRVYVGFCDKNNVGRIGYVDLDPDNPGRILRISYKPVLDIGRKGCFDDNGVVPISILTRNDQIYLYYVGFQLGVNVPYYMFGGLAISKDGTNFRRYSESPILDRMFDEVYARCGIFVMDDDDRYKMWYIGSQGDGWTLSEGKKKPLYVMKYTESDDGLSWNKRPVQCLEYKNEDEHGFGRPFVWKEGGIYKMLYSIRTYSRGYYIGYAESEDGVQWIRKDDEAGIESGVDTWDDTNLSYPVLFRCGNKTYMFYNGNGCGKTGFGYAELVNT